jgi:glutaminyl-tRNA synthetase
MRAGEFPDGARTLRAKIDMASPNINLRDPVLYRIRHGVIHHQTGSEWCLYPTYDYTHPISDALEGITHSLCTLEFEDHRPLYDWCVEHVSVPCQPRQIEFSRLNLEYTVMSKRLLTQLVEEGIVRGWDDPRMPTIAGLRRRGFTPGRCAGFCERIGVTKADNLVEMGVLESAIREDSTPRRRAPWRCCIRCKVVLTNLPDDAPAAHRAQSSQARGHGHARAALRRGTLHRPRDFEGPAEGLQAAGAGRRGAPAQRLRDPLRRGHQGRRWRGDGAALLGRCRHPRQEPGGPQGQGRDPLGLGAGRRACEVRLYDRLFTVPQPGAGGRDFRDDLNPDSLRTLTGCIVEPSWPTPSRGATSSSARAISSSIRTRRQSALLFNRTVTEGPESDGPATEGGERQGCAASTRLVGPPGPGYRSHRSSGPAPVLAGSSVNSWGRASVRRRASSARIG